MARYSKSFKSKAISRLLAPECASLEEVSLEVGIGEETLERWREEEQSRPARGRAWTAAARLEAVITTAALDERAKSEWCRQHGVFPADLAAWRASCAAALAAPEAAPAAARSNQQDRKKIKELERNLLRKDRALAEAAALLILSKKVEAIFNKAEEE